MIGLIWRCIFIVFYPFLTLFSVIFTGLIKLLSSLSSILSSKLSRTNSLEDSGQVSEQVVSVANLKLVFKPLKEIHFGPQLYTLQEAPAYFKAWEGKAFSMWHFTQPDLLLLQHWPSTEEHTLDTYQLILVRTVTKTAKVISNFKDFDWRVIEAENELIVQSPSTNENTTVAKLND